MEIDILKLLEANKMLLLFLVIGIGYVAGNIRIGGIPVGSTIGVLLAGLLFGHFGYTVPQGVATFGFALFIFSVGIQAGPTFFGAFREDGLRYIVLAAIVAVTGFSLALGVSKLIGLDAGFTAGLLAGALTSTPTLAGAQDAVNSGLAKLSTEMDPQMVLQQISVGYALTYIVGTVSLILIIHFLPRLLHIDLPVAARNYAKERGILGRRHRVIDEADMLPIIRAYRVGEQGVGKTVKQRGAEIDRKGKALRLRRDSKILEVKDDTELMEDDVISLIASLKDHQWAKDNLGEEVLDPGLLNYQIASREIIIIDRHIVGKSIQELDITNKYGCIASNIKRAGIQLPLSKRLLLNKGDILQITGEEEQLNRLAEDFGHIEEEVEETDLMTFAFGLVGGLLLGMSMIKIGTISIGLGTAGGLLLVGIVIGYVSSINPTFGRVPTAARYMLMELGLTLFMAAVGLGAGGGLVEAFLSVGPIILLGGLLVTLTPVFVGYLFGVKVLKLNPALLLGSITGAMTSTPSLNIVTNAAKSGVPALGYAGTYTFANVMLTFAGTLIMIL
ncbi:MAG: TrkA C-terminal domain-containing protein [Gammaproteobacteria bacterium]|nr:TrkA C-terminal domain-containing protein [Gammaproteobacteria bacterium]